MELDEVPEHLLVVGGGYVGVEFGQMFRRFGSQVTIVQRRGQVLTREDPDVAEEISCSSCARMASSCCWRPIRCASNRPPMAASS